MTSFFEAQFRSKGSDDLKTQIYKATDLEDAMRQHERTTQIMQTNDSGYTCDLVTMSEVTSKSQIKRLKATWAL